MQQKCKVVTHILLPIISVALCLGLLEGGLYIARVLTDDFAQTKRNNWHPSLLYTAKPNLNAQVKESLSGQVVTVVTNSHGFRTHEFYPKPPGTFRILLLGDSFVYGSNCNQDETIAAVIEKNSQEGISKDIEVFSLGVGSYSAVRYASLMRLYADELRPDMVIVAVDQSDFNEDVTRLDDYVLDEDGYPVILKEAQDPHAGHREVLGIDAFRNIYYMDPNDTFKNIIRKTSIYHYFNKLVMKLQAARKTRATTQTTITYDELVAKYGDDLSQANIPRDLIPYSFDKALKAYRNTFKCLDYVRKTCERLNIPLYVTSYPYPWMVSDTESGEYVLNIQNGIWYDFRTNRVHPQLLEHYASLNGIRHINSYDVIQSAPGIKYGASDPHFNAYGYALYANFIFDSIQGDIRSLIGKRQQPVSTQ